MKNKIQNRIKFLNSYIKEIRTKIPNSRDEGEYIEKEIHDVKTKIQELEYILFN